MIPLLCYCRIELVLRKRLKTIDSQFLIDKILKYQGLNEHLILSLGTSLSSL